jgi:hypothetical protein
LELAAYLRANHWKEVDHQDGRFAIWLKGGQQEDIEVLLPLDPAVRDFAARMAEALHALEVAEGRSQLEILADIGNVSSDVIRIAAEHESLRDGTLPLERGVVFVEQTYSLILAAACGAFQPREVFHARKPAQATEYIKNVRLGQSEYGSYILTVRSPVPPALKAPRQAGMFPDMDLPFERRVTRTLMRALAAVREAAERSITSGELEPFTRAVQVGVSANLCDAIVGMHEGIGADQIRFQTTWSPMRMSNEIVAPVIIPADAVPIIKEAGHFLRASAPRDNFELRGFVVGLRRQGDEPGRVTIAAIIDKELRNVQVDLNSNAYQQAVEAHSQNLIVRCEGELYREGRSFILRTPRNFTIEQEALSPTG